MQYAVRAAISSIDGVRSKRMKFVSRQSCLDQPMLERMIEHPFGESRLRLEIARGDERQYLAECSKSDQHGDDETSAGAGRRQRNHLAVLPHFEHGGIDGYEEADWQGYAQYPRCLEREESNQQHHAGLGLRDGSHHAAGLLRKENTKHDPDDDHEANRDLPNQIGCDRSAHFPRSPQLTLCRQDTQEKT